MCIEFEDLQLVSILYLLLGNRRLMPASDFYVVVSASVIKFLGALAKLRKSTIIFAMSVCLSARPHATTGLTLNRF